MISAVSLLQALRAVIKHQLCNDSSPGLGVKRFEVSGRLSRTRQENQPSVQKLRHQDFRDPLIQVHHLKKYGFNSWSDLSKAHLVPLADHQLKVTHIVIVVVSLLPYESYLAGCP